MVSQLNQWANFFFQSQEIVGDRLCDFPPVPPVRLIGTRLSEKAFKSKAGLLCNPLTCADGGYLPGYLLVKNLWHLAAGKCEHLRASDLFLTYLRCFFYEDYGFVAVLLDPSTRELKTANAITIYFSRRLQEFMDSDFTDVTRFEKEILQKNKLHESGIDTIGSGLLRLCTDAQADQLGRKRFQALIDETSIYSPDFLDDMLRVLNQAILFQRDIMCVGSLQVSLSVSRERDSIRCQPLDDACKEVVLSKGGKVLLRLLVHPGAVQRELRMACQYDSGAIEIMMPYALAPHTGQVQVYFPSEIEEGESEGSLDLFFSQSATYKVCVISRGEKPIAYLFLDPQALHQEETGEAARKLFMERHIEKPFLEKTHAPLSKQILEAVVDKCNPLMKLPLEHFQKHINSNMDRFYLSFAFLHVQDEKLEECINAMRKHGFYEILGKDTELVEALAFLGISTSLTASRKVIAKWFSSYGSDLDTTIAALQRHGKQYSLPEVLERRIWVLGEQEDGLGCLV